MMNWIPTEGLSCAMKMLAEENTHSRRKQFLLSRHGVTFWGAGCPSGAASQNSLLGSTKSLAKVGVWLYKENASTILNR